MLFDSVQIFFFDLHFRIAPSKNIALHLIFASHQASGKVDPGPGTFFRKWRKMTENEGKLTGKMMGTRKAT